VQAAQPIAGTLRDALLQQRSGILTSRGMPGPGTSTGDSWPWQWGPPATLQPLSLQSCWAAGESQARTLKVALETRAALAAVSSS